MIIIKIQQFSEKKKVTKTTNHFYERSNFAKNFE